MEEKRGPFARFLAISSGLACAYLSLWAIFSHPLGIAGAAMLFLAWGLLLKLIVFVTKPEGETVTLSEESSKTQRKLLPESDTAGLLVTIEEIPNLRSNSSSVSSAVDSGDTVWRRCSRSIWVN